MCHIYAKFAPPSQYKCQGLDMQRNWRQWMNNVNLYKPLHVRMLELGDVE